MIGLYQRLENLGSLLYAYVRNLVNLSDCGAPLIELCRKNVINNVAHSELAKVAFEFLRSRMLSALISLIFKQDHDAEC